MPASPADRRRVPWGPVGIVGVMVVVNTVIVLAFLGAMSYLTQQEQALGSLSVERCTGELERTTGAGSVEATDAARYVAEDTITFPFRRATSEGEETTVPATGTLRCRIQSRQDQGSVASIHVEVVP